MAILTHDYIKRQMTRDSSFSMENFSAGRMIKSLSESTKIGHYDIFLSHSYLDFREIAYLQKQFIRMGCTVFVDWIEYPELDRSDVTKINANIIRTAMKKCSSLIYAYSENSTLSAWMPWELGFFDGYNGNICILPISNYSIEDNDYQGVEYLGIYPFISLSKSKDGNSYYYVNYSKSEYETIDVWIGKIKNGKRVIYG